MIEKFLDDRMIQLAGYPMNVYDQELKEIKGAHSLYEDTGAVEKVELILNDTNTGLIKYASRDLFTSPGNSGSPI